MALLVDKHIEYISKLDLKKDDFEYWVTEHLRLSGIYWGLTALDLMNSLHVMDKEVALSFLLKCQHENGGFGGNIDHDPHLLYTLSAIQVLALFDAFDRVDKEKIANFVASLQQPDGSFAGDKWGEIDTRFSYIGLSSLSLLGYLDKIDVKKATDFILRCKNFDGAFGCIPDAESHAGQAFCCVAALAIGGRLDQIDRDLLGWWLCERQVPAGGLNGRPEKLPDVCYSWWVLSCLSILHCLHWINQEKLKSWILQCQDTESGGIADKPGDLVDLFHTFFGVAGLSLLGYPGLMPIDPVYALPVSTLNRLGLPRPWAHATETEKAETTKTH